MRKQRGQTEEDSLDEPLINLTPLIDVVFVVLITFMLIAPVLDLDHVELAASGPSSQKNELSPSPISIYVKGDNTIWFQGSSLTPRQLEEKLKIEKMKHPAQTPQVIQDCKAEFGTYQIVKNTLETCGFDQMDIVLKPK